MYKITDGCVGCGTCEAGCPVSAITMGDTHYEIDTEKCIECGSCKDNCPVCAIDND